ncbi:hypothetical protein DYL59_30790 [Pseudomonas kairouanensis]|uniref:Uncharacterized protein n=1 Tax=Pseudomonas kairouanensis TaxID=2293832 RepID=A0A4Z0ACH5_9PSED|nr:hypothetical protein [Pseudomonas kairouanensis]TFY84097.1 hypothetical protein DYL59_30790 [Pseudomonas kairouanensis]
MSYLEAEIDEALEHSGIENRKFNNDELGALITSLRQVFFGTGSRFLDPAELRVKHSEHNPNFWQEISGRILNDDLILVVFDTAYRAWSLESSEQLKCVLSETTGYPFWVTDRRFSFLVYVDDHDCVNWA